MKHFALKITLPGLTEPATFLAYNDQGLTCPFRMPEVQQAKLIGQKPTVQPVMCGDWCPLFQYHKGIKIAGTQITKDKVVLSCGSKRTIAIDGELVMQDEKEGDDKKPNMHIL